MKLYENNIKLNELILLASEHFNMDSSLIEKDYYVTLILKQSVDAIPGLVFKGGTSLSKCHKIIKRFSEDVDLTLDLEHSSQSFKRNSVRELIQICDTLPFELINKDVVEQHTHSKYNCYRIIYPFSNDSPALRSNIIVEMVNILKCYPSEESVITSYIGEYLIATNQIEVLKEYELEPFPIKVQSLSRTLVDKVFALCDYYMRKEVRRNSRHIYDIYKLLKIVSLDDDLSSLIDQVRKDRQTNPKCVSSFDGVSINTILREIIDSDFYKKDYEEITSKLLFEKCDYDTAIVGIRKIIDSNLF